MFDFSDFKTSKFMYALGLIVVAFIIVQSIFFMTKAIKRGRELGISKKTIKDTIFSSALFTIAPSAAILATVLTLAGALGIVLPWIRLTVIGNLSYEATAAQSAAEAMNNTLSGSIESKEVFTAISWVMTIGSVFPLVLLPILLKKIQSKVGSVASKNARWGDVMSAAAFIGLISAFIARAVAAKGDKNVVGDGAGVLSLITLISSILIMLFMQFLCKKFNLKKLEPFAMPVSMIGAMAIAVIASMFLPENIVSFEWRG